MSQPRVPRQSTDIVLKLIAAALGGDLFARFGVPLPPIFEALPTELPRLEVRTQQTDQLFRLADDSILHLEFQTTLRPGELMRFCAYNLAVCRQYQQPVWTVVLYGVGIRSAPIPGSTDRRTFGCRTSWWGRRTATPCCSACTRRLRAASRLPRPTAST